MVLNVDVDFVTNHPFMSIWSQNKGKKKRKKILSWRQANWVKWRNLIQTCHYQKPSSFCLTLAVKIALNRERKRPFASLYAHAWASSGSGSGLAVSMHRRKSRSWLSSRLTRCIGQLRRGSWYIVVRVLFFYYFSIDSKII